MIKYNFSFSFHPGKATQRWNSIPNRRDYEDALSEILLIMYWCDFFKSLYIFIFYLKDSETDRE